MQSDFLHCAELRNKKLGSDKGYDYLCPVLSPRSLIWSTQCPDLSESDFDLSVQCPNLLKFGTLNKYKNKKCVYKSKQGNVITVTEKLLTENLFIISSTIVY